MSSAAFALQQSIFQTLAADAPLLSLLGAPKIYDDTPQPVAFPYVTFGHSTTRDLDTSGGPGDEHVVTLHVWSRAAGRKETHGIIDALRSALHDRALPLAGHRLINLRHDFSEARRDPDGDTIHGIIRLRAVTEPL